MKDVAKSVIERINRDVGTDIANLSHCKNITNEYAKRVAEIESEVNKRIRHILKLKLNKLFLVNE